jgi:hypothetical protein
MKCFHHSIKNVGSGEEVGIVGNGKEDGGVDREKKKLVYEYNRDTALRDGRVCSWCGGS